MNNNTFDLQIAQIYAIKNLAKMQQLDIETKDRVDISLKKYEEMKDKIKSLEELLEAYKVDNSNMTNLLLHLDIPEKILSKIDPSTVKTKRFDGPFDDIEDSLESGKIRFVISFDVIKEDLLDD